MQPSNVSFVLQEPGKSRLESLHVRVAEPADMHLSKVLRSASFVSLANMLLVDLRIQPPIVISVLREPNKSLLDGLHVRVAHRAGLHLITVLCSASLVSLVDRQK